MSLPPAYPSATAFRQALEARLLNLARTEQVDIQRLRRQIAFDRFLCRLFHAPNPPWVLKGGYAMELQLDIARTTRDIDLAFQKRLASDFGERKQQVLQRIQNAAARDLADGFVFQVGEATQDLDAAPYGGERYPVEAQMDGRLFVRFHLDVGIGDAVLEPVGAVHGRDWLQFAGVPNVAFSVIPREQQFAEKYHAYTLPRGQRENSRVRDLLDMLLLIREGRLDSARTQEALRRTFRRRDTHAIPAEVPLPPADWTKPFSALAKSCGLIDNATDAHAQLAAFLRARKMDIPPNDPA
jgi:hypothetical protein